MSHVEQGLVMRAKDGDRGAFEPLVRPEIERLYGLAGLIVGDSTRAEDAVREGLLRAWRDLPRLRQADKLGAGCAGSW